MACRGCGGKKTGVHVQAEQKPLPVFPGEVGFLTLEYVGKAAQPVRWKGPVTGIDYVLGGDKRVALMDKRDALEFLTPKLSNGAKPVFRLYREQKHARPVA